MHYEVSGLTNYVISIDSQVRWGGALELDRHVWHVKKNYQTHINSEKLVGKEIDTL